MHSFSVEKKLPKHLDKKSKDENSSTVENSPNPVTQQGAPLSVSQVTNLTASAAKQLT
jgi:hypothetical protein